MKKLLLVSTLVFGVISCGVSHPNKKTHVDVAGDTSNKNLSDLGSKCSQPAHADILNNAELKTLEIPVLLPCSVGTSPASASKLEVKKVSAKEAILKFVYNGFPVQIDMSSTTTDDQGKVEIETGTVPADFTIQVIDSKINCATDSKEDETPNENEMNVRIKGFKYSFGITSSRKVEGDANSCLTKEQLEKMASELTRILFEK